MPRFSNRPLKKAKCCSAKISVGAIMADWYPDFAQEYISAAATAVFPLPTSPSTSLFIAVPLFKSAPHSEITLFWAKVREYGKSDSYSLMKSVFIIGAFLLRLFFIRLSEVLSTNNSSKTKRLFALSSASRDFGKCIFKSDSLKSAILFCRRILSGKTSCDKSHSSNAVLTSFSICFEVILWVSG